MCVGRFSPDLDAFGVRNAGFLCTPKRGFSARQAWTSSYATLTPSPRHPPSRCGGLKVVFQRWKGWLDDMTFKGDMETKNNDWHALRLAWSQGFEVSLNFRRGKFLKRFAHCEHMSHMGAFLKSSGLKMIGFVYFDRPETFFDGLMGVVDMHIFLNGGLMDYLRTIASILVGFKLQKTWWVQTNDTVFRNPENPQGCCFCQGDIPFSQQAS